MGHGQAHAGKTEGRKEGEEWRGADWGDGPRTRPMLLGLFFLLGLDSRNCTHVGDLNRLDQLRTQILSFYVYLKIT